MIGKTVTGRARRRARTERFELAAGGIVLVEPSHDVPLVSITIALRTGSALDPEGEEGLLRTALRMIRRGGAGKSAHEIEDEIDRLGAELGVDVAASSATIAGQVIARNLDAYVSLLGSLLANPAWDGAEFGRLLRETESEIVESRDSDRALASRAFRRAMFPGHPFGRSPGGTVPSVRRLTIAGAKSVFERTIHRRNVLLAFAGDVTAERARELAERLLKALPRGKAPKELVPPPVSVPGRRLVFVDKPERSQTQVGVGTLGTSPHDPDHVSLGVANAVFGGTFTSRLMQEVRSKRGWSYGASSRLAVDRQRQAFSFWTFPAAGDCAPCLELELGLFETFVAKGITTKEASFIKKFLARSNAFEVDTAAKRVHQALDVEVLGLPADYYTGYVRHVEAVTPASANAAIKKRLSTKDLLVVVVGTAKDVLEPLQRAIPGLETTDVIPFDRD